MVLSYAADIAAALLIIVSFVNGAKKGFIKSVWKLAAWILTIVLTMAFLTPAYEYAKTLPVRNTIKESITVRLSEKASSEIVSPEEAAADRGLGLPVFLEKNLDFSALTQKTEESIDAVLEGIAEDLTDIILKIAVFVILFLAIRLLLWIAFHLLDLTSKLPVIKGANKLLGGVMGLISMLFVIYIVCAFVSFFASGNEVVEVINSSYIVKYFYNNNILLRLAFGI